MRRAGFALLADYLLLTQIHQHFHSKSLAVFDWHDRNNKPASGDFAAHQLCWLGWSAIVCRLPIVNTIKIHVNNINLLALNLGQKPLLDHRFPGLKERRSYDGYDLDH